MENESINNIKGRKKYYTEEKYDLFFDYNNNSDYENNIIKNNNKTYCINNDNYNNIPNFYNNYSISNNYYNSFNKSYNEAQPTNINLIFNSSCLNEYIQNKKEAFNKLSNSMNKIINKHKIENNDYNLLYNKQNKKLNYNNKKNLNNIVDHLIKAYSKDELKLIKEKINNKVDEYEEEPQPEKLSFIEQKNYKNKLKLSSDSPSFLKTNNNNLHIKKVNKDKGHKNKIFKKINKSINFRPIKINCNNNSNNNNLKNNKNIYKYINSYITNNNNYYNDNIKFKPEFYTYIKCKTSFEYLDNFFKRQKSYKNYINNKMLNLTKNNNKIESQKHTFIPNTSFTYGSKYSIKLEAQRFNETMKDKEKRMIYNSINKRKENNKNLQIKYNKSFTFTPNINISKINKKNIKKISKKNSINNKSEKKESTPIKYVNHKYDYITSIYKNDEELLKRIKEQNEKKIKKYEKLKTESDNEKLEGCTFKPDMSKTFNKSLSYNKKIKKENNIKYDKNINNINKDNKTFTYVDFYQYKKNIENNKKKNNNEKVKDINKIGSLTPIIIPKNIKKTNIIKNKNHDNNSFSIIHKLIHDNKPK